MSINEIGLEYHHFGKISRKLCISNRQIVWENSFKDFGIIFDKWLMWMTQINQVRQKVARDFRQIQLHPRIIWNSRIRNKQSHHPQPNDLPTTYLGPILTTSTLKVSSKSSHVPFGVSYKCHGTVRKEDCMIQVSPLWLKRHQNSLINFKTPPLLTPTRSWLRSNPNPQTDIPDPDSCWIKRYHFMSFN